MDDIFCCQDFFLVKMGSVKTMLLKNMNISTKTIQKYNVTLFDHLHWTHLVENNTPGLKEQMENFLLEINANKTIFSIFPRISLCIHL